MGAGGRRRWLSVAQSLAGEGFFERDEGVCGALVAAVDVDAEGFEFVGVAAAADAQLEASVADHIDDGGVFGDAQGVFKGQDDDGGAEAQALRALADGGEEWEGGGQHAAQVLEVVLGDPDCVEAELVGGVKDLQVLAVGLIGVGAAAQMAQEAEAKGVRHSVFPRSFLSSLHVPRPGARCLNPHCRRR